jgi:hypothetical protein
LAQSIQKAVMGQGVSSFDVIQKYRAGSKVGQTDQADTVYVFSGVQRGQSIDSRLALQLVAEAREVHQNDIHISTQQ